MLDNDRQELIAARLRQRNAMQPCQRCLSEHFEILAEAEMPLIANNLSRMSIPSPSTKSCRRVERHASGLSRRPGGESGLIKRAQAWPQAC
jgi:hypothetical protein